jgi:hypothetical protein
MADYFPVLVRAVSELNPNTSERRQVLYARARTTLIEKFQFGCRAGPSQPDPAYAAYAAPAEEYQDRPPLKDAPKRLKIAAGAFGALAFLLAGVAAYSLWPHIISRARSLLYPPRVAKVAAQPNDDKSYIYMRQIVYYRTNYPVGTIVVDKSQAFLYVVRPNLAALRYTIGIGPECTRLVGLYHVVRKEKWPGWVAPPQQLLDVVDARKKNPLGARALNLNQDYRIHGTNEAPADAQRAIECCIGLDNNDVIDLYDRTPLGNRVVVLPQ